MRLVQPLPGGTVAGARAALGEAQGFAANVANNPGVDTYKNLTEGVKFAKLAAAELFMAEPRSPFQDLVLARQHVIEGQQTLQYALKVLTAGDMGVDPAPFVRDAASKAFDAFEGAFEILDND